MVAARGALGDLRLEVVPASAEALRPYGRLLAPGRHLRLDATAGVTVSIANLEAAPPRFERLERHVSTERVVVALGPAPLLVVLLVVTPDGPRAAALRTAPGEGVSIDAGVWHTEPFPLAPGRVLEVRETRGAADRIDWSPVERLTGHHAIRVVGDLAHAAPSHP